MRLIDADDLYDLIDGGFDIDFDETPETKRELLRMIKVSPTIDAEPVRHGHFIFTHKPNIYGGITIKCSECGYEGVIAHIEDHHYCWVCGAKMEEVKDNE